MKGGQDREEGAAGPVASGGSLDGAGSQAKIKPASKKRKSEATKASSAGPGSLKKAKESAKDAGQTSNSRLAGGTKKAAKDKEASGKDRDGATPKAKESNKKKKDTSATQQGQQQAPQTKVDFKASSQWLLFTLIHRIQTVKMCTGLLAEIILSALATKCDIALQR